MSGNALEHHGLKIYMDTSPPNIERVFGYDKYRRWVAFFWSKQEDACLSFDGYAYAPISGLAWDSFFSHQLIVALNHKREAQRLKKIYDFGDMRTSSRHWLLLDRQKRTIYVGEKNSILDFFRDLVRQAPDENSGIPGQPIWIDNNIETGGASSSRLEMINGMIQWLDRRLKSLKESGRWPDISKI